MAAIYPPIFTAENANGEPSDCPPYRDRRRVLCVYRRQDRGDLRGPWRRDIERRQSRRAAQTDRLIAAENGPPAPENTGHCGWRSP